MTTAEASTTTVLGPMVSLVAEYVRVGGDASACNGEATGGVTWRRSCQIDARSNSGIVVYPRREALVSDPATET